MSQIEELHGRITAAMARISTALATLSEKDGGSSELAAALEEEKLANAQLEERLHKRGTESPEERKTRLVSVREELGSVDLYDYVVINDVVEQAVSECRAILTARRCRLRDRMPLLRREWNL